MVARIIKRLWGLRPIIIFMSPALIAGALIGTYPGYKAFEYTWVESAFCVNCHIHDYANVSWKKSIHGGITTCHDCHHQPLIQYFEEAAALIRKKPQFPVDMKHLPHVDKHPCQSCHWDFGKAGHPDVAGPLSAHALKDIPKVNRTRLHKLHLEEEVELPLPKDQHLDAKGLGTNAQYPEKTWPSRPIMCVDCHGGAGNRAHNFSATDVACVRCHGSLHQRIANSKTQKTFGCRNCHFIEFLVETEAATPASAH